MMRGVSSMRPGVRVAENLSPERRKGSLMEKGVKLESNFIANVVACLGSGVAITGKISYVLKSKPLI